MWNEMKRNWVQVRVGVGGVQDDNNLETIALRNVECAMDKEIIIMCSFEHGR
jgi:hypothetical protein